MTFFAPAANVELAIGGRYEMLFDPDAPPGSQGGEGLKILSFLPEEMLSFEWNAPPQYPSVRQERTWVVVQFEALTAETTRVRLSHLGWQEGEEWEQVFAALKRCHAVLHEMGAPRVSTNLRLGTRVDRVQTMQDKLASVRGKMEA